jgi:IPT/TIG domain
MRRTRQVAADAGYSMILDVVFRRIRGVATSPDVSGESVFRRLSWLTRYELSKLAYDRILRPGSTDSAFRIVSKRRFSMAFPTEPTPPPSKVDPSYDPFRRRMTVYIATLILAIWVVASIFYAMHLSSVSMDLIYGSVQAIRFAAVGAATVGGILNTRLVAAERRALAAERLAEQHRGDAAKGRALAAALQASDVPKRNDAPGADIRRQQAQFSRLLYGDLVVRDQIGQDSLAPVVTDISPNNGPVTGGTIVVVTGSGFTDVTGVSFGTVAAANLSVSSDTQLTATSPATHVSGTVDVTVTTRARTSATTPAGQFTYAESERV